MIRWAKAQQSDAYHLHPGTRHCTAMDRGQGRTTPGTPHGMPGTPARTPRTPGTPGTPGRLRGSSAPVTPGGRSTPGGVGGSAQTTPGTPSGRRYNGRSSSSNISAYTDYNRICDTGKHLKYIQTQWKRTSPGSPQDLVILLRIEQKNGWRFCFKNPDFLRKIFSIPIERWSF